MKTNMILSASGWRKIFAISNNEQDKTAMIGEENIAIAIYSAKVFAEYLKAKTNKENPTVTVGMDARPTGSAISEAAIKTFLSLSINVQFIGITAAPEIMVFSRQSDGFMYISASHNPVGHNGIKFGLNDGGVLEGSENAILVEKFNSLCQNEKAKQIAFDLIKDVPEKKVNEVYENMPKTKLAALSYYKDFLKQTISASKNLSEQKNLFDLINKKCKERKISVVADMNGSARSVSVDKDFFEENGIGFYAIHNKPGEIAHEIIPEAENLIHVAKEMEKLQKEGHSDVILGYMPDCDGDRGNIVYWDEKQKKAVVLMAQQVFSLSVLAELSFQSFIKQENPAVCVNCPTSMRIDEIASRFGAKVFRSEVGEANVVHLAMKKRSEGYSVRIFGEGSNGGTITYPSAVRDPINTIFAIIKLLVIDELYKNWCNVSKIQPKDTYNLTDILNSIPSYTTTGVSEKRAILNIKTKDHSVLKAKFQKIFEYEFEKQADFFKNFGIYSWECRRTNGTEEVFNETDFSKSKKGGLKILFKDKNKNPVSFIWMRGSGTEPVFRIMCDVKGKNEDIEKKLLDFETKLLLSADNSE